MLTNRDNSTKEQLIDDIEKLLNSYQGIKSTTINPELLVFMDNDTLKHIIGDLLDQKESEKDVDIEWLKQFKTN